MEKDRGLQLKAEELEQTLNMQLARLKQESEGWVKVGGTVVAGGIAAFMLSKLLFRKKSRKTDQVLLTLKREGLLDDDIKARITGRAQKSGGFMSRLGAMLLPMALNFGKEQLRNRMAQSQYTSLNEKK